MERLIEIAENLPEPEGEGSEGSGEGNGEQSTPPFPPAAEIAFILAELERLAWQTRTRQPGNLAEQQGELVGLLGYLEGVVRPGSRAEVLLDRSLRAMLSAEQLLSEKDLGPLTQNEQDAAMESLAQLLRESQNFR